MICCAKKKTEKNVTSDHHKKVSDYYANAVSGNAGGCCHGETNSGSISSRVLDTKAISTAIGYTDEQLAAIPEEANLGFGCGNPTAIDTLKQGETVLDLGSGAGIDAFWASKMVGENGQVIGVDMTDEMLLLARRNAEKMGVDNVLFKKGVIEDLPLQDESVDVVISNCVINLAVDKQQVFDEIFRVLKPGGRMMVSDIVLEKELPREIQENDLALAACVSGASIRSDYLRAVENAGLKEITIKKDTRFALSVLDAKELLPGLSLTDEMLEELIQDVRSLEIYAEKP